MNKTKQTQNKVNDKIVKKISTNKASGVNSNNVVSKSKNPNPTRVSSILKKPDNKLSAREKRDSELKRIYLKKEDYTSKKDKLNNLAAGIKKMPGSSITNTKNAGAAKSKMPASGRILKKASARDKSSSDPLNLGKIELSGEALLLANLGIEFDKQFSKSGNYKTNYKREGLRLPSNNFMIQSNQPVIAEEKKDNNELFIIHDYEIPSEEMTVNEHNIIQDSKPLAMETKLVNNFMIQSNQPVIAEEKFDRKELIGKLVSDNGFEAINNTLKHISATPRGNVAHTDPFDIVNDMNEVRKRKAIKSVIDEVNNMESVADKYSAIIGMLELKYYETDPYSYPRGFSKYNENVSNLSSNQLEFLAQDINTVVSSFVEGSHFMNEIMQEDAERKNIAANKLFAKKLESASKVPSRLDKFLNKAEKHRPTHGNFGLKKNTGYSM